MRLGGSALGHAKRLLSRTLAPGCELRRKGRSATDTGEAETETLVTAFRARFAAVRAGESVAEERLVAGRAWRVALEASVDVRQGDVVVRLSDGRRYEVVAVYADELGQAMGKTAVVAWEGV